MSTSHENLYRRTIDCFVDSVEKQSFSEKSVPRMIDNLRAELAQCLELRLISAEFYVERMEVLQKVVGLLV